MLQQLIDQLRLDYVNSNITEANFPLQEVSKSEHKLFNFDKCMTSEEVKEAMEKDGFRPGNIYELLTWGKDNWDGKKWVVALDSFWVDPNGHRGVSCLHGGPGSRYLRLVYADSQWFGSAWFFGLRLSKCSSESGSLGTLDTGRLDTLEQRVERLEKIVAGFKQTLDY